MSDEGPMYLGRQQKDVHDVDERADDLSQKVGLL